MSKTYHLRLQTNISANTPEQDHLRYIGAFMSGELTRPVQNWGTVGVSIGLGMRQYEGNFPLLGKPREDRSASIGISFRSQKIRVFGSSPKVSCQVQQSWSNVALYDYQSTDCALTFVRNF